jgi:CCCH zinc finger in TRM13 protein
MNKSAAYFDRDATIEHEGCAFIVEESDSRRNCGESRRPGSSYCPEHHVLCHLAYGSAAEADRLREVEAIASAVAGRRSRYRSGPSRQFLRRLERTATTSA